MGGVAAAGRGVSQGCRGSYRWLPYDMKAVGIKVLKNRLSHYVRLAQAGETVLVTDRDEVVAELRPPTPGRARDLHDARLAEMVRSGVLRPASAPREGGPPQIARLPVREVLEGLSQDRADRG